MSFASTLAITQEESEKRKYAIDFARGSCRFEGIVLESEIEEFNQLYIDGKMTGEQHTEAVFSFIEKKYPQKPNDDDKTDQWIRKTAPLVHRMSYDESYRKEVAKRLS